MLMLRCRGSGLEDLAGTSSIVVIRRLVSIYKHGVQPFIPFDVIRLERIAMGIAFLLVMIYKPDGVIPEKLIKFKDIHDEEVSRLENR